MRRTFLVGFLAAAFGGVFISGAASAQTCTPNVPHITGTWKTLPYQMPINPISASLLPTGKVLIVAGSENDAKNSSKQSEETYRAAIWDPTGTDKSSIAVQNLTYDVFCSGTAALADGRSLVVGGTSDYSPKGENRASIFDPSTGKFAQSQNMVEGRWYATATTLGDGRVMAMSGLTQTGGVSTTVEIYDLKNAGAGWNSPTSVPFGPPLFPHVFLLPNGKVFYTGQGWGGFNANAQIFDPANGSWTASAGTTMDGSSGSSVILPLLPPSYAPRVMNFGGGSPATQKTEIIDLSVASPTYAPGPNMSTRRIQMNAVILPNGKVLAEGGSVNNEAPDTPGKTADLYDPVTNTFSSAGTAAYSRLYHSTAILLPDATVASMGSNPGPRGSYEPAIEIYTPPYLFDANDHLITTNRPSITGLSPASGVIGYGAPFSVSYTSTSTPANTSAVLARLGSATHGVDMDQRLIGLCGPSPQPPCNGDTSLTASPTSIGSGGTLNASWSGIATPSSTDWVGLFVPGAPATNNLAWIFVSCTATPGASYASGSCPFTIPNVAPGTYELRLFSNNTYTTLATSNAFAVTTSRPTSLTANPTSIGSGGTLNASWSGIATPSSTDWVGLFVPGAPATNSLAWIFVSCTQTPGASSASGSCPFTIPNVAPGTYELRLFSNNTYTTLATSNAFAVTTSLTASRASIGTGGTLDNTLILTTPLNPNVAPPGYYMLFLLDGAGVPSKARFIQLTQYSTTPPVGAIAAPASDVTISAGGAVAFGTSTTASKYSWVFPGGSPVTSTAQNPGNVTFPNAGTYQVSLTVIDSSGNSDPSPPTRTITVLPTTPDFSITVGPVAKEVFPGGSAAFTVTVTPLSGFAGTVNLSVDSESGFPTGIASGGFNPASISGSGSSTLLMNTTTSTIPWALSLTVTGASGAITHIASTTLMVNLAPPASLAATPGDTLVNLSWPASVGATSYHVKRANTSGGPYVTMACPAGTSYPDMGLTDGIPYYYVVSAAFSGNPNAGGESADSIEASATPQAPSPPSPPTGLAATPGNGQVALAWNPSSGATSYRVKRATVSGGPYGLIASPTSPGYTDTSVTNGTTYYYVVSAVNAAGESNNSSQVSATPQAPLPSPPTGLAATPGNGQVALAWNPSSGATSYRVKRATVSGGPYGLIASPTSPGYTDTSVTNGTTYYYVVSAVNAAGESNNSSQVSATPQAPLPSPPTGLAATPGNGQVALAWNPSSGATSYRVKRATVSGGPYGLIASPTSPGYTDTSVTNGTTYYYVVSAVNAAGESNNSSQVSATPTAVVPAAPMSLTAKSNKPKTIDLIWIQSITSGVTKNSVYRKKSSDPLYPLTPVATINATTSYRDAGVSSGTIYCYVVTAIGSGGESGRSNEACANAK